MARKHHHHGYHHHHDPDRVQALPDMAGIDGWFSSVKKGIKKAGKVGLKVGRYTTPVGLAVTAVQKRKAIGRGLKKAGKLGVKGVKLGATYGTPIGLQVLAAKKVAKFAKKAFGGRRPSSVRTAGGSVDVEETAERLNVPEDAVIDAAAAANRAGSDPDARAAAVDEVEEAYGLDDDALTDVDSGGGEDDAGEDDAGDDADQVEGMDGAFSFIKKIGKGIGKGAKAVGKGAKTVGKTVGKGAKVVGKAGVAIGTQVGKQALATYLGQPQPNPTALTVVDPGTGAPSINWRSPIVLGGGAAVALGAVFLLSRKKSQS